MGNELAIHQDSQLAQIEGDERGLQLRSLDDMRSFAMTIVNSGMAPASFKNSPDAVLVAMQHGMEVGLSPLAALQSIAIINNRPTLYGDGLMAVARAHPACEDIIETFERGEGEENIMAVCVVHRKGCQPLRRTFSVADARKAALWDKAGPWKQYPKRMLQMRARGFALRDAFADALKGFRCTEEERDIDTTPREVRGRVVETKLILPGDEAPEPTKEADIQTPSISPEEHEQEHVAVLDNSLPDLF